MDEPQPEVLCEIEFEDDDDDEDEDESIVDDLEHLFGELRRTLDQEVEVGGSDAKSRLTSKAVDVTLFSCDACRIPLFSEDSLREHGRLEHDELTLKSRISVNCVECEESFVDVDSAVKHSWNAHVGIVDEFLKVQMTSLINNNNNAVNNVIRQRDKEKKLKKRDERVVKAEKAVITSRRSSGRRQKPTSRMKEYVEQVMAGVFNEEMQKQVHQIEDGRSSQKVKQENDTKQGVKQKYHHIHQTGHHIKQEVQQENYRIHHSKQEVNRDNYHIKQRKRENPNGSEVENAMKRPTDNKSAKRMKQVQAEDAKRFIKGNNSKQVKASQCSQERVNCPKDREFNREVNRRHLTPPCTFDTPSGATITFCNDNDVGDVQAAVSDEDEEEELMVIDESFLQQNMHILEDDDDVDDDSSNSSNSNSTEKRNRGVSSPAALNNKVLKERNRRQSLKLLFSDLRGEISRSLNAGGDQDSDSGVKLPKSFSKISILGSAMSAIHQLERASASKALEIQSLQRRRQELLGMRNELLQNFPENDSLIELEDDEEDEYLLIEEDSDDEEEETLLLVEGDDDDED